MSFRVVFGTNVLFSAIGWAGTPDKCLDLVRVGRIHGLTCVEILDELAEKLSVKLGLDHDEVDAVLGSLLAIFEVVPIAGITKEVKADPKDDKVLECAVAGNASHIVLGISRIWLPSNDSGIF